MQQVLHLKGFFLWQGELKPRFNLARHKKIDALAILHLRKDLNYPTKLSLVELGNGA